jgi:hypothetical protein
MYLFKEYLARRLFEASLPVPPGVDPEMWANASYQKFWLNTPAGREYAAKFQQQANNAPPPVARALGSGLRRIENNPLTPPAMNNDQIEAGLNNFLGMNNTKATLKELLKGDPALGQAVRAAIANKTIPVHENGRRAVGAGRGIHFYKTDSGDIMFMKNTPGSNAF